MSSPRSAAGRPGETRHGRSTFVPKPGTPLSPVFTTRRAPLQGGMHAPLTQAASSLLRSAQSFGGVGAASLARASEQAGCITASSALEESVFELKPEVAASLLLSGDASAVPTPVKNASTRSRSASAQVAVDAWLSRGGSRDVTAIETRFRAPNRVLYKDEGCTLPCTGMEAAALV